MAEASAIVGDRHVLMILRGAFYGVRRFDDFLADLQMSRATLSDRLRRLTQAGILETSTYTEPGSRPRKLYTLTPRGTALLPVVVALSQWGEDMSGKSAITFTDRSTGRPVRASIVDSNGKEVAIPNVGFALRGN